MEEGSGVELVTWAGGEVISTEIIQADGMPRQSEREGCSGMEEADFSAMGGRVYLKADYVCEGGERRAATGLMAMLNPMEWLDVKVVQAAGQKVPWTLRYRLARASRVAETGMENVVAPRAMAVKGARIAASRKIMVDDIVEAVGKVDAEAVEALIVERGDPLDVNADVLLALSDAGVSESVIDLVVAVSYPDRFAVKPGSVEQIRPERTGYAYPGAYGRPYRYSFWNPYFYDPFYSGYGYYGGYGGYYGYGYGGGYYRPTTVVVQPRPSGPSQRGRVVKGRGYTRTGSGYTGSSGGSRSPSSGRVTSSGGTSRSGSARSTGRTAKPRGGGGL
jgi:hypothetical protein